MAKKTLDEEMFEILDAADDINPYSSYLNKSTLSTVKDWIDTGNLALNAQISGSLYGGIPDGRIVQFAGPSQTAKSFFVQKIIANAQKKGKYVIVYDSENAIDEESAKGFGIDTSKVKYIPALTVENTRNHLYKTLKGLKDAGKEGKLLVIIDSLGNLESELGEKRIGDDNNASDMGSLAKALKSLLKTATNWGRLTRTPIVVTNHVFDDPSAMFPSLEKNMSGGKAAVYLPSVTLQLARKAAKDDDGKTIDKDIAASQKTFSGVIIRSLSVKNRFTKQYVEIEMYLSFSRGLDRYYGLLEIMKGMGVVVTTGTTYVDWEGKKLGFYKNWRKDVDLWENRLLPELETRIKANWCYGNKIGEDLTDAELDSEDEDTQDVSSADYLSNLEDPNSDDDEEIVEFDEAPDEE